MPNDVVVPEGWTEVTLGSLGRYLNGRAFKTSEWAKTGRPIIRIQDLTGSNLNPNYFQGEVEDRYVVQPGDFLISWSATLGAYIWDGPEAVLNQHIFKVESGINKKFHYHLVRDRIAELERNAHGSGMVHVTKGVFEGTPVAIPEDEGAQAAIARVIDLTEAKQQSAAQHLAVSQRVVKRFRQAVLAAACSGRLTAEWRSHNMEGAAVTNGDDPLPAGWQLVTLGDLTVSVRGGSTEPPSNEATGYPILRSSSVRPFSVDYNDVRFLLAKQSQREDNYLRDGDLLVTRLSGSVEYVGNAAVIRNLSGRRIQYPDRLFCCRLKDPRQSRYVGIALTGPRVRQQIEAASRSAAGHQRISISDLKGFTFACPTLDEQNEIVRRVESLLRLGDGLIERIQAAQLRVDRSMQATLAKAFRGELTTGSGGMSPEGTP